MTEQLTGYGLKQNFIGEEMAIASILEQLNDRYALGALTLDVPPAER